MTEAESLCRQDRQDRQGKAMTVEVGGGGWILDIVSPVGFADDVCAGCERKRGVKGDAHIWPESPNGDKFTEGGGG